MRAPNQLGEKRTRGPRRGTSHASKFRTLAGPNFDDSTSLPPVELSGSLRRGINRHYLKATHNLVLRALVGSAYNDDSQIAFLRRTGSKRGASAKHHTRVGPPAGKGWRACARLRSSAAWCDCTSKRAAAPEQHGSGRQVDPFRQSLPSVSVQHRKINRRTHK